MPSSRDGGEVKVRPRSLPEREVLGDRAHPSPALADEGGHSLRLASSGTPHDAQTPLVGLEEDRSRPQRLPPVVEVPVFQRVPVGECWAPKSEIIDNPHGGISESCGRLGIVGHWMVHLPSLRASCVLSRRTDGVAIRPQLPHVLDHEQPLDTIGRMTLLGWTMWLRWSMLPRDRA
jgi:hypothetical protein